MRDMLQRLRQWFTNYSLTATRLNLVVAVFLTFSANYTFFNKLLESYPFSFSNSGFLISLVILLISFQVILFSLVSLVTGARVAAYLLLVSASLVAYFSDQFGVVINTDMLHNMVETNTAEALDLLSSSLVLRLAFLGILPAFIVYKVSISKRTWLQEARYNLQSLVLGILIMAGCIFSFSDQYASFFREHKSVRNYVNPGYPVYSLASFIKETIRSRQPHIYQYLSSYAKIPASDQKRELVVVVVGETARADHFSLNGYNRNTNPLLAKEKNLVSYKRVSSCGTSTFYSVPCMFSLANHESFNVERAYDTENVLGVLKKAGVNILWRDNNSSDKGAAVHIDFEDFRHKDKNPVCDPECRDVGMLSGLQQYIDSHKGDMLIVLHHMGSHGPAYYKRYPADFEHFKPACHTQELSSCSKQEIINAYDNTILYTDYFLSEVIKLLKNNQAGFEPSLLYISDHGESLGENGVYLHGLPYMLAPQEQTHVPIILWAGDSSDIDINSARELENRPSSHDAIASSLLAAFEIETDAKLDGKSQPLFKMKD